MRIRVGFDDRRLRRSLRRLQDREIQAATVQALNRTAPTLRTAISRGVAQETGFPVGVIRRRIKLIRARLGNLAAVLDTLVLPIPLILARRVRDTRRRGVRSAAANVNEGFIATMPRGHRGVYVRRGKARLPIDEIKVSISDIVDEVGDEVLERRGPAEFQKNFDNQIRRRLRRLGF